MVGNIRRKILSSGSFLIVALLVSNALNLIYNAYLGKTLTFSDFGLITLINTLLYIFTIVSGAVASTVNRQVSYLTARFGHEAGVSYHNRLMKKSFIVIGVFSIAWVALINVLQKYFNLTSALPLWSFLPILTLGFLASVSGGFAKGRFLFYLAGIFNISESLSKLLLAIFLVQTGHTALVYLTIPFSITVSSIVTLGSILIFLGKTKTSYEHTYKFSKGFFAAAVLTGLSTNAFLTFDILLTKHFFSATEAGRYAFLALVGKMIFFFGSLFNTFLIPFVGRDEGSHRNPNRNFYILFFATSALTISAGLGLTIFGHVLLPIVFGKKALDIIVYLLPYGAAISLYTMANTINIFHLARRHYFFSVIALIASFLMGIGIVIFHKSISEVVDVILTVSIANFIIVSLLHFIQRNGGFFLNNLQDLFGLFKPLPKTKQTSGGKRILIFNWRDTKHVFAGGAEIYIHELAKRWVQKGATVTIFCGNDSMNPRYEIIDGVQIIRRGGFYMVYVWAFFYYIFRFRGKYDVVIDCENGIPFFTPLYAKEKTFLLIHHVHQEVFRITLRPPLSWIGSFLELRLMPMIYENIQILTVSPSSSQQIKKHVLARSFEPIVIYNGVDLQSFKPGKKSKHPTVLYLGRLKYYKTINSFIKTAKFVQQSYPDVEFIIAGDGEEKHNLQRYAHTIGARITFKGKVTQEEKINLMKSAWVFMNPSRMEGWGITTIEANACGTPVIAANVPGLCDSVKDGYNGILVKHHDVPGFVKAVQTIITDEGVRKIMSADAINWAQQFDWDKSANISYAILFSAVTNESLSYTTKANAVKIV